MIDYKTLYQETKLLRVLLVEDHELLRKEMTEVLEDLFYAVTAAVDGEEALAYYTDTFEEHKKQFDLIISDIQMPNMNGVTLSKKIREMNKDQPILILSAYTESDYLLELINIGISKFITKPLDYDEFFSILYEESQKIHRIKPNLKESSEVSLGEGYYWQKDTRSLKQNGQTVELTKHELLLLEFFISKSEHICSNQHIIEVFYQHDIEMSERNIRNLIFKLRKKIPQECIQSVYGLGYKFLIKIS